jgi:hypothetical protein
VLFNSKRPDTVLAGLSTSEPMKGRNERSKEGSEEWDKPIGCWILPRACLGGDALEVGRAKAEIYVG